MVYGAHQAHVAVLNQVDKREAVAAIAFGDADDQPGVGTTQALTCGPPCLDLRLQPLIFIGGVIGLLQRLPRLVPQLDLAGEFHLLLVG